MSTMPSSCRFPARDSCEWNANVRSVASCSEVARNTHPGGHRRADDQHRTDKSRTCRTAKAALIGKPASYTSLAFQRPLSLPEQLSTEQTDIPIPFVIHNAGTDAHDYQWQVQLVQGTATRHVSSGTIHIASGRSALITQAVQIPCVQGQVQVIVSLALPAESIDARAECRRPSR